MCVCMRVCGENENSEIKEYIYKREREREREREEYVCVCVVRMKTAKTKKEKCTNETIAQRALADLCTELKKKMSERFRSNLKSIEIFFTCFLPRHSFSRVNRFGGKLFLFGTRC